MNPAYVQTVNLLLDIAPTVFQTPRFAMKGGTALNLFVQDLPRLSVDIDVVFINHLADRVTALEEIAQEIQRIEAAIAEMGYETRTRKVHGGDEVKLDIFSAEAEVKVEVNFVFRGTILPVQARSLSEKTQVLFSKNIQIPVLSPINFDALLNTQQRLMTELPDALTQNQRNFLLSLVEAAPDWSLLPFNHLQDMPAIKWKLQNLSNLKSKNPAKFRFQREELAQRFQQQ